VEVQLYRFLTSALHGGGVSFMLWPLYPLVLTE